MKFHALEILLQKELWMHFIWIEMQWTKIYKVAKDIWKHFHEISS